MPKCIARAEASYNENNMIQSLASLLTHSLCFAYAYLTLCLCFAYASLMLRLCNIFNIQLMLMFLQSYVFSFFICDTSHIVSMFHRYMFGRTAYIVGILQSFPSINHGTLPVQVVTFKVFFTLVTTFI